MADRKAQGFWTFVVELLVYSVLVVVYVAVALRLLNTSLKNLYDGHKILYAVVALVLIITQGVVLEMATSALVRLLSSRRERG